MEKLSLSKLPLGFRFRPTDEELISHYLRLKINCHHSDVQVIPEIDVCKWEPWDLPDLSVIKSDDPEWFFFCPRDRKYPNGHRSNRATEAGYWKATGKDRNIKSRQSSSGGRGTHHLIGIKKTLVFYKGRAPKGERTNWIMHEYRATEPDLDGTSPGQAPFVLCRLFRKPVEKAASSKSDEFENSFSSPATTKSSPDNTSSELFQEQVAGKQMKEQSEGINKWLTNKVENTTPKSIGPGDSCPSEVEDHSIGEAFEMKGRLYTPQVNGLMYQGLPYGQRELCVSPTLEQFNQFGVCHVDSPYADDFGNDLDGVHFQDGTGEQDVSFTELLEVFGANEHKLSNLASQKYSDFGMKSSMNANNGQGSTENSRLMGGGLSHDTSGDMQFQPIHAYTSTYEQELRPGCKDAVSDHPLGKEASTYDLFGVSSNECERSQPSHATDFTGGSEIIIRERQAQNKPSSSYIMPQGTAPRRVRLQVVFASTSAPSNSCFSDGKDVPTVSEVGSNTNCSSVDDIPEVTSISHDRNETADKYNGVLRQRSKAGGGMYDGAKVIPYNSSVGFTKFGGPSFPKVYVIGVYLIMVLSIVFTGIWKCPSFKELHS